MRVEVVGHDEEWWLEFRFVGVTWGQGCQNQEISNWEFWQRVRFENHDEGNWKLVVGCVACS